MIMRKKTKLRIFFSINNKSNNILTLTVHGHQKMVELKFVDGFVAHAKEGILTLLQVPYDELSAMTEVTKKLKIFGFFENHRKNKPTVLVTNVGLESHGNNKEILIMDSDPNIVYYIYNTRSDTVLNLRSTCHIFEYLLAPKTLDFTWKDYHRL